MKKEPPFLGVATALATPFDEYGVDYPSLAKLIEFQLTSGADAIVVCGTTGEASTLSDDEKKEIISFSVRQVRKRVPVIAGTGCNDTKRACELSEYAAYSGADALLAVTPYYNKCTRKGLVAYYDAIAEASRLPFIIYNVPSRTGVTVEPETAFEISANPLAAGFKDAGDSISATAKLISLCGDRLPVYSGNDDRIIPILSLGGSGVISVASNIVPKQIKKLCTLFFEGDIKRASALQTALIPLINALFSEVNPIPLKAAMEEMGLCRNILRAPLTKLTEDNRKKLFECMDSMQTLP